MLFEKGVMPSQIDQQDPDDLIIALWAAARLYEKNDSQTASNPDEINYENIDPSLWAFYGRR